jgi:hypothetical protein
MGEFIEKEPEKRAKRRSTVAINLPAVPIAVHNKIIKWNLKLSAERGRQISLMEAYTEFLKEHTKNLAV